MNYLKKILPMLFLFAVILFLKEDDEGNIEIQKWRIQ